VPARVAYRPDTQDRSQNQVPDADDVRKSVQPTSKERVDWKKPDIRNQQGDKQTLEITAIKENARFHDEPFSRGKRKRLKFWHEDGYR
jgi:hypothetical protein